VQKIIAAGFFFWGFMVIFQGTTTCRNFFPGNFPLQEYFLKKQTNKQTKTTITN